MSSRGAPSYLHSRMDALYGAAMERIPDVASDAFVSMVIGNLHLLRWLRAPSVVEVARVTSDVEKLGRRLGVPLVCIGIVPGEVDPPGDDARRRMLADLEKLMRVSESVHFVVEGSGFKHVMLRSVVTGLILVAGRRGRIFVHLSVEDALREVCDVVSVPTATILATARAGGILVPGP